LSSTKETMKGMCKQDFSQTVIIIQLVKSILSLYSGRWKCPLRRKQNALKFNTVNSEWCCDQEVSSNSPFYLVFAGCNDMVDSHSEMDVCSLLHN
jgi:hypothetical protein